MTSTNPGPELGTHKYQGPFTTSHDYQEVGEREGKRMYTLLTVASLFGIHLFLVHKRNNPSIIHFVFHNIHLSYYTSLFVHFWIVITNFALLDYCNIFNLYGNVLHIPQYIIYNTHG